MQKSTVSHGIFLDYRRLSTIIYAISFVLLFLSTFYFKFFWNIPNVAFLLLNLVCFLGYGACHTIYVSKQDELILFLLVAFILLHVFSNNGTGSLGMMLTAACMSFLILVEPQDKLLILNLITTIYATICFISLIGWILVCIFHIYLPMHISQYGFYKFYDYGIFNIRVEGISFSRYLGMFIEPGYTGVMCALLLTANGYNLRKVSNLILLISALFTLSLATYLLILFYFLFYKFSVKKLKIAAGILVIAIIGLIIIKSNPNLSATLDYFVGNRINKMFNGNIFGNRFSNDFSQYYRRNILRNPWNLVLGVGSEELNSMGFASAGYRVFIAQDGILNLIIVVIFHWLLCAGYNIRNTQPNWKGRLFFIIWLFSFIDISYPTWASFIITMVCGSTNMYINSEYQSVGDSI